MESPNLKNPCIGGIYSNISANLTGFISSDYKVVLQILFFLILDKDLRQLVFILPSSPNFVLQSLDYKLFLQFYQILNFLQNHQNFRVLKIIPKLFCKLMRDFFYIITSVGSIFKNIDDTFVMPKQLVV